jgi:CopG family nickel-responsive transcriptional regulator
MLRGELVKREWRGQKGETVGVLVLVHDHDTRALADKLTDIQHHSRAVVVSALHVHLNAHMCLEVVPLRGTSVRGVRYGQLVPATTGAELT